jgi:hypothetical protein
VVPGLHFPEAMASLHVQLGREVIVQNGHQDVSQVAPTSHPLKVLATIVVVRAVQFAPREGLLYPFEKRFMADVHSQGDLGLTAISSKVAFTDE